MAPHLPNIVVVGGSYVGTNVARQLAARFHGRFRVLLIEKNSHFHHLFAFPRFAVTNDAPTAKAFIPFLPGTFAADTPPGAGTVLQACVTAVGRSAVQLDRAVALDDADGRRVDEVPFAFLVLATGTDAAPPARMPSPDKRAGVAYLQQHAALVAARSHIVVVGGGAVGVQMATDIKDLYPAKSVTLVHSRPQLMNRFAAGLDTIVQRRCAELGIRLRLGTRVVLPPDGRYPDDGRLFDVLCTDGSKIPADMVILASGQKPQSGFLHALSPQSIDATGFVRVQPSLQIADARYPNIFAIGDIAATGAGKAARPAARQAEIVVANIDHICQDEPLEQYNASDPHAIHLTLGIKKNIIFRNPAPGSDEFVTKNREDGALDMGIDNVWSKRGGGPDANL